MEGVPPTTPAARSWGLKWPSGPAPSPARATLRPLPTVPRWVAPPPSSQKGPGRSPSEGVLRPSTDPGPRPGCPKVASSGRAAPICGAFAKAGRAACRTGPVPVDVGHLKAGGLVRAQPGVVQGAGQRVVTGRRRVLTCRRHLFAPEPEEAVQPLGRGRRPGRLPARGAGRAIEGLPFAVVTGHWALGLPSIDIELAAGARKAVTRNGALPVEGDVRGPDGEVSCLILVWVEDAALAGLEYGWYSDLPTDRLAEQ